MPAEIFVDTSAWYPLTMRSHPDHAALAAQLREVVAGGKQVVTTNLVVAETHALLLRRAHRRAALAFVDAVGEAPNLVVRSTEELERAAVSEWILQFDDQDFSFTDAVSFATMKSRKIDTALALHRHFRAAGFRGLE